MWVIASSEPFWNASPAGFQNVAQALSANATPVSPIPLALESGTISKNGTAVVIALCASIVFVAQIPNTTIIKIIFLNIICNPPNNNEY